MKRTLVACLSIAAAISICLRAASTLEVGQVAAGPAIHRSEAPAKQQVLFNRYQTPVMTVFIADADGTHERALALKQARSRHASRSKRDDAGPSLTRRRAGVPVGSGCSR